MINIKLKPVNRMENYISRYRANGKNFVRTGSFIRFYNPTFDWTSGDICFGKSFSWDNGKKKFFFEGYFKYIEQIYYLRGEGKTQFLAELDCYVQYESIINCKKHNFRHTSLSWILKCTKCDLTLNISGEKQTDER